MWLMDCKEFYIVSKDLTEMCKGLSRNFLTESTRKYKLIVKTNKCTNMYCIILKHTLKHLKSSYMFRSMIIIREYK
jgi:hypothetical protein